jgi:hypothetical protein
MPAKKRSKSPSVIQRGRLAPVARAPRRTDRHIDSGPIREMPLHPRLRGRPGELIHYASRLLFTARFLLEQAQAEEAVRAVNRALNAASFARADQLKSAPPAEYPSLARSRV